MPDRPGRARGPPRHDRPATLAAVTPLPSGRVPMSPAVLGSVLILAATGMSGVLGPFLRLLYDHGLTPLAFAVWRGIIAGATLWLFVAIRQRRGHGGSIVPHGLSRHERLALL